jgi:hypothetical protein
MSTVNYLMTYLNKTFGMTLPFLPLNKFTQALTAIWKSKVTNWASGDDLPTTVTIELNATTTIPLGSGEFGVKDCTISLTNIPPAPVQK